MTGHGGNIHKASQLTGIRLNRIFDFSASINPLGVPKSAALAIKSGIGLLPHYPEPFADSLSSFIARHYSLQAGSVICGNGSTELIYLPARFLKPKKILITAPTFSEYEKACNSSNGKLQVVSYNLQRENNFDIDPDSYIQAMKGGLHSPLFTSHSSRPVDMAFLCNPNNPTGRLLERESVLKIAAAAKKAKCYLIVDEAFMDFCPDETVVKHVSRNPYLIVLRSLTKFYALAGLRIGFGVFPQKIAAAIKKQKEPWTVNCLADTVAKTVLEDSAYSAKSLETIRREKRFLETGFERLGIKYIPSSANYYLVNMKNAQKVIRDLAGKGILVRDCSNFPGLGRTYIRLAVRTRRENEMLLKELAGLCQA